MIKKKGEVEFAKDNEVVSATSNKMVAAAAAKMVGDAHPMGVNAQDQIVASALMIKSLYEKTHRPFIIRGLKSLKLTSLKDELNTAIKEKNSVNIDVNSKEPEEILKGTYIADSLSKQGYSCNAKIQAGKDILNWICEPSE